ncbi:MAG: hypothetical protein HYT80_07050 [Euryarchaeota archaeon]|nr:hypothetical protein [Euryarchaeota archaeon]
MSPEPAPTPAATTSTAQWEAVAEPQPALDVPAAASPPPADDWVLRSTIRRGIPGLMVLGWTVAFLGLLVLAFAYQRSFDLGSLYKVGGIRADYLGAAIFLLGAITAAVFHFLPGRRPVGILPTAPRDEVEGQVRWANGQVLMGQIMVGGGVGLGILGMLWMVGWLYLSYTGSALRVSTVSKYEVPTHYIGAVLLLLGLLLAFLFLGRVGMARAARNLAVVAHQRGAPGVSGPAALPGGVSEAEVRNLVKRLDGLMAKLPDDAVTEFSRTPEADTYLKLLGS